MKEKVDLNDNGFTHLQLTFQVQIFVFFLCLLVYVFS
jgi:hypothetical protein